MKKATNSSCLRKMSEEINGIHPLTLRHENQACPNEEISLPSALSICVSHCYS
jgi:hypothetical protein